MKKIALLFVAAMLVLGSMTTTKASSWMSTGQRYYFDYISTAYYGFIWDYGYGVQESNTGGFISYDAYLTYYAQNPGYGYVTHVAYIYDTGTGRYVEDMATLDHLM